MGFQIPDDTYDEIARMIQSRESPVGIDAEKTHVLILHKLEQIEKRLERLEEAARAARCELRGSATRQKIAKTKAVQVA